MGSLLFNAALLGGGFVLGRVPLLPLAAQLLEELHALPTARKVSVELYSVLEELSWILTFNQVVMLTLVTLLVALYVLGVLLPLRWVATQVSGIPI